MTEAAGITLPKIMFTTSIPDSGRGKGRANGETSIYQKLMIDMPAPAVAKDAKGKPIKDGEIQFSQFFVPAEVPATITDPAERDKEASVNTKRLVNRFTAVSRRIRKDHGETHDFTFRKARDPNAENGTQGDWGIIVYRIQPGTDKGGPPARKAA